MLLLTHRFEVRRLTVLCLVVVAAHWSCAACAQCVGYKDYFHWVGKVGLEASAEDLSISGDYVYVAGGHLDIVDISDPSNPAILAGGGELADYVVASGGYVYIVWGNSLSVYEGFIPQNSSYLGSVSFNGSGTYLAVSAGTAYVGSTEGLQTIDVSNPSMPQVLGSLSLIGEPTQIIPRGDTVFISIVNTTGPSRLDIVNVSDPTTPQLWSSIAMPAYAHGVAVWADYAYVAHNSGLSVIDISTLSAPQEVGTLNAGGVHMKVAIAYPFLYISNHDSGVWVADISNPIAPIPYGGAYVPGAWSVDVSGTNVIVGSHFSGVHVFDASTAASVPPLGYVDVSGSPVAVAVTPEAAYVVTIEGNLEIVDVSNVSNLVSIGSVALPSPGRDVAVLGNYAFVAAENSGLVAVDVSNTTLPVIGDVLYLGIEATCVRVVPGLAFVGGERFGKLVTVDLSDPLNLTVISTAPLSFGVWGIAAVDTVVYVTGYNGESYSGIRAISFSDPARPNIVWSNSLSYGMGTAEVDGDHLVVSGMTVFDISVLAEPVEVGSVRLGSGPVALSGDAVYCVDRNPGFNIGDISDSSNLRVVGRSLAPYNVVGWNSNQDIEVDGETVYVAGPNGLWAFPAECGGATSTILQSMCAMPEVDAVRVCWSVAPAGAPPLFRLLGSVGSEYWDVRLSQGEYGFEYCVQDSKAFEYEGETVQYSLYIQAVDGEWSQIGESSIYMDIPNQTNSFISVAPNPFNPMVRIEFSVGGGEHVRLAIFDLSGRSISVLYDDILVDAVHSVEWNGTDFAGRRVAAGVYSLRLTAQSGVYSRQVTLIK